MNDTIIGKLVHLAKPVRAKAFGQRDDVVVPALKGFFNPQGICIILVDSSDMDLTLAPTNSTLYAVCKSVSLRTDFLWSERFPQVDFNRFMPF